MNQDDILLSVDWTYLAEGNQHIILKYSGTIQFFLDKILRVEKQRQHFQEESHDNLLELHKNIRLVTHANISQYLNEAVEFQSEQLAREKFLAEIELKIHNLRPSQRLAKKIDNQQPLFLCKNLFYDYSAHFKSEEKSSLQLSFDFEIKPKSPLPIMDETYQDMAHVSKFFKVQLQKLQKSSPLNQLSKQEIDAQISKYDPHHFFIDQEIGALQNLFKTPANNLKLFHRGLNVEDISQFVQNTPQNLPKIIDQTLKIENLPTKIHQIFSLPTEPIEKILKYYDEINQDSINQGDIQQALADLGKLSDEEKIRKIQLLSNFLLMITWSDISIIGNIYIFDKEQNDDVFLKDFKKYSDGSSTIYFRLSIVDYDLKHLSKFQEYKEQAIQLNLLYKQYINK